MFLRVIVLVWAPLRTILPVSSTSTMLSTPIRSSNAPQV